MNAPLPQFTKVDSALALAERGLKVFPIRAGQKAPPYVDSWPTRATVDRAQIRSWWAQWPDANIGVHTAGMAVLDVDVKKEGDKSLSVLDMVHGLPDTLTTITPSGGRHVFYKLPEGHPGVSNSVEALGKGLDVRSTGGYVVAPGSEVPAGRYRFAAETPIAGAPDWLLSRLGSAATKAERVASSEIPDADDATLERARQWLDTREPAIEGQGGDFHTKMTATQLRDRGASEQQAFDLMADEWNSRCAPPWDLDDLRAKVRNGFAYVDRAPRTKAGVTADDFAATTLPAANDVPPAQGIAPFSYVEAKRHDTSAPRPFIVKGLAAPGRVIEFLGKPGNSKTALLCHTAKCIARGKPWFAKATKRYAVVFVASEGRQDVLDRLKGYDEIHGEDANEAPILVLSRVNFSSNDERNRLVATIGGIEQALSVKVGALMVDTLAASTSGDENDTAVMRDAAQRIRSVAEHFDLAAFVSHHPTKSNEETSRGAGAWLGAIDQQIFVKKHGGSFQLSGGKQRQSGLGAAHLAYDLESAKAGVWEDGDVIGVPVVRERGAVTAADFSAAGIERQAVQAGDPGAAALASGPSAKRVHNDLLRALQAAQKAAGGAAVSGRAWRATYAKQQGIETGSAGAAVRRNLPRLRAGLVGEADGLYFLANHDSD